jgi:N6-L-threonylcarbamoyladenine synthase
MRVIGIETSCDETSVAIVDDKKNILTNIVLSQLEEHKAYGGVVPEIAARSHITHLRLLVKEALYKSNLTMQDIDAIAVTAGPGLIGGLIVGLMFAKGMALASNKPLIAVNHLEGHALTARLIFDIDFPFLLLLISGGHCQILEVNGVGDYKLLGTTLDDAVGEAFDKVAKMLNLGCPGGPIIEQLAKKGNIKAFELPLPLAKRDNCDFSFSGLKTAVKRIIDSQLDTNEKFIHDICASFQYSVAQILCLKLQKAFGLYSANHLADKRLIIAGGVAANAYLNSVFKDFAAENHFALFVPPINLCTDNAAMIAWAGLERFALGLVNDLNFEPRSRWPLTELRK